MTKMMQLVFKLLIRFVGYVRGALFLVYVRLCGGKCEGIPYIDKGVVFKYPPHKGVAIGRNVRIGAGCFFDVPPNGSLSVGNNVKITGSLYLSAAGSVIIGDEVLIAEFVSIRDSEHEFFKGKEISKQGLSVGKIRIGKDVWICRGSTVLYDVIVEDGAIIGANSLLKKNLYEKNGVFVGAPAHKVKTRVAAGAQT